MAAQLGRVDLAMREGPLKQVGIATQVSLEQVDAAAMHGHRRRVRQIDAVPREQLEAAVLPLRVAAIGLEDQGDGGEPVAVRVADLGAQLQQQF